jgi:hypothetical protein
MHYHPVGRNCAPWCRWCAHTLAWLERSTIHLVRIEFTQSR